MYTCKVLFTFFMLFLFVFFGTLDVIFFSPLHIHVVLFEINRDAVCKWYLVIMLPWLKLIWGSALMYSSMCKSNVLFILFTLFCFVFVNIIRWYSHTLKNIQKKKFYLVSSNLVPFCEALLMSWHVHLRVLMHCI